MESFKRCRHADGIAAHQVADGGLLLAGPAGQIMLLGTEAEQGFPQTAPGAVVPEHKTPPPLRSSLSLPQAMDATEGSELHLRFLPGSSQHLPHLRAALHPTAPGGVRRCMRPTAQAL